MSKYDYLVVGAGLFGAVFAERMSSAGKKVLVIDRRNHIAGNVYTENDSGIEVHKYGPHIFHTDDSDVWAYVNRFATFNNFLNCPVANYHGKMYSLPFNMHTFSELWGVASPIEAEAIIRKQSEGISIPKNLEEQAIKLVGTDVYKTLVKEYTEKQWGRECKDLPASIIRRLPVRFTYDNRYFDSRYQGIPENGYTAMVEKMLAKCSVILGTDYIAEKESYDGIADIVLYTGAIDEYYDYRLGFLEYRTREFETVKLDCYNFQGNAVVNYTSHDVPWIRSIEHKWFAPNGQKGTVVTMEYSSEWKPGCEPFYPVNDEKNNALFQKYRQLANREKNTVFGGRLADYAYYDMDVVIRKAISMSEYLLKSSV